MGAILLGALTIAASFIISFLASRNGVDVGARFLERGDVIPSRQALADAKAGETSEPAPDVQLSADSLSAWLTDPLTERYKRPYAFQVILPDFVFIGLLGAFMVTGSLSFAEVIAQAITQTVALPQPLHWLWWLLMWIAPVAYVASDGWEDILILRILLRSNNRVNGALFDAKKRATKRKLWFATAALTQTIVLGLCSWLVSDA